MADLSDLQAAQTAKIVGSDTGGVETNAARVTPNQDIGAVDTVNASVTGGTITLSGTPVELKIGGSRLANRKYIWMEALGNNVKWGFGPTVGQCPFDCFKSQLFSFPIGDVAIYAYATTGTPSVAFGEGA